MRGVKRNPKRIMRGLSRITNGRTLPKGIDQRTTWVRRFKDINRLLLSDLGGETEVSEAERAIVRRASTILVALEALEGEFATKGEATAAQLEAYGRAANTVRRLLETTGIRRRPKDITADLQSHIAQRYGNRPRMIEHEA
jgi:hypothetical protein